jgi:hypothetical protein
MSESPVDARITELEHRLEKLRIQFEQHFLGNERMPPVAERDKFARDLRALDPTKLASVPRFRLANLNFRLTTFDTYWQKNLRAIEEGTYARDKFKADLHERVRRERTNGAAVAPRTEADERASRARTAAVADEAEAFLAALGAPPTAASPATTGPPPGPALGLRGVPVAPSRGTPVSPTPAPLAPPMRGAPLAPPPTPTPAPAPAMRGAPVAPPPTPAPAPAPPMRGAPVAPPPASPMRGRPVGTPD